MSRERFKDMHARVRTSMQNWQASPPDKHQIKQDGWQDLGILVIDVNHGSLTNAERAFIENLGTKFYGRRRNVINNR
jgi:hypothetical protein